MMAAGEAARRGNKVLLMEKMEKVGRKVRISGKGRCNITNMRPEDELMEKVRTNREFFLPAYRQFNNRRVCAFFERMGVKLTVERGERVFPKSGKAWDVADALLYWCRDNDVEIMLDTKVERIETVGRRVLGVTYTNKRGFMRREEAPNIILATGGVSYPATGSTGDGYRFAHDLGHGIEAVRPSLVPLETSLRSLRALKGTTMRNVAAKLIADGETLCEEFGEIGFSDRGVEGAVTLRFSRDAVDALIEEKQVKIVLDLKPALTEEMLRERIARERSELAPTDFVGNLLRKLAPKAFAEALAIELDLPYKTYMHKLTDSHTARLVQLLKGFEIPITDYRPFTEAVVTAGGIDVADVDPETMQSKLVDGLYFAGEVLDLDANTGGFNLQIAFSTGHLAGQLKK